MLWLSSQSTMEVVPQPKSWFKLQTHVTDSFASKTLCCVRAGKFKNRYSGRYDMCPHCRLVRNKQTVLQESHVLFNCPIVSRQRRRANPVQNTGSEERLLHGTSWSLIIPWWRQSRTNAAPGGWKENGYNPGGLAGQDSQVVEKGNWDFK